MDLLRGYLGVQNSEESPTLSNVLETNPIRDECTEIFDLVMQIILRLKLPTLIIRHQALHDFLQSQCRLLFVIEYSSQHVSKFGHLLEPFLMILIEHHSSLNLLLSLLYSRLFRLYLFQSLNRQPCPLAPLLQFLESFRLLLLFLPYRVSIDIRSI
jgi:hypothetical protein